MQQKNQILSGSWEFSVRKSTDSSISGEFFKSSEKKFALRQDLYNI